MPRTPGTIHAKYARVPPSVTLQTGVGQLIWWQSWYPWLITLASGSMVKVQAHPSRLTRICIHVPVDLAHHINIVQGKPASSDNCTLQERNIPMMMKRWRPGNQFNPSSRLGLAGRLTLVVETCEVEQKRLQFSSKFRASDWP